MNVDGFDELVERVIAMANAFDRSIDRSIKAKEDAENRAMVRRDARFYTIQESVLHGLFIDAVDAFYQDYDPIRYSRRKDHTLYSVWRDDPPVDNRGLIDFDDAKDLLDATGSTTVMRSGGGAQSLFEQTFMEGWHGGAYTASSEAASGWWPHPNPGIPFWRRPGRRPNGTYHKWGRWYKSAKRMHPTPYSIFESSVRDARTGVLLDKFIEIHRDETHNAMMEWLDSMTEIITEEFRNIQI